MQSTQERPYFEGMHAQPFLFGWRPLPFGGSHCRHVSTRIEAYLRTSGDAIHHRQSVCAGQNQRYANWTTASPGTETISKLTLNESVTGCHTDSKVASRHQGEF